MLEAFFNPFLWDKDFYSFNRREKDMYPYSIHTKENGIILVHNVVGINKEDLDISIKEVKGDKYLIISGNTKSQQTQDEYSVNSKFRLDGTKKISSVKSELKNGLLYIYINFEKPIFKEQKISIN